MKTLYHLTEDDFDSLFYEGCAEKITGEVFAPVCRRMRKGSGVGAVRASLLLALGEVRRMALGSGVHLLLAMDNDRAPHAAAAEAIPADERHRLTRMDQRKTDRYSDLVAALEETFGPDRGDWPIPAAIAVPVEMIESWLLLVARGGNADALPRFARRDSPSARHFHQAATPPPQLKDLRDEARRADGFATDEEWALHLVIEKLEPADLARRSPTFALFKQWLDGWPKSAARAIT